MELARKMEALKWQNKELEVTAHVHIHVPPHSKFKNEFHALLTLHALE